MLAGASLVQIGTMNYQNPNIGPQIRNELSDYLDKIGISDLHDLIGIFDIKNEKNLRK